MKSVLISIRPKWCEKIASGDCNILVKKSAPKEVPFKAYIYCTKDKPYLYRIDDDNNFELTNSLRPKTYEYVKDYNEQNGKVIGEFICDKVEMVNAKCSDYGIDLFYHDCLTNGCLTEREIEEYFNIPEDRDLRVMKGNGYAWHISDLKIYDKPKELSEFRKPLDSVYCSRYRDCCEEGCVGFGSTDYVCNDYWNWEKGLTRPPQSWQFVGELEK